MKKIQNHFISGILIVAPLALSIYVAWVVVGIADKIFRPFIPLNKFGIPSEIPGVGLIVAFLFFTILGAIAGSFFGKLYHRVVDAVLSKIPGLNSIYNTVKQIIDTFATTQSNAFKEVVLIEYPQKDIFALAFLTSETKGEIAKRKNQKMINAITENAKQPEIKDVERRLSSVIRYEYGKPVDALENITQGFYANKVVSHDAFNKTITTSNFDYIEKGKLQPHTEMSQEAGLLYPEKVEYSDTRKPLNEMFDSKLMVKADTKKIHNDYEDNAVGGLGARTNQLAGFRNHNLSLLVYGNTLLNAGDIITFTTPVLRPGEDGDDNINPYTSGRYVIMAMKHTVNTEAQRHEMVLKCYKDSVRSAYPTEEEALSNIGKADIKDYDIYEEQLKEFGGGVDF